MARNNTNIELRKKGTQDKTDYETDQNGHAQRGARPSALVHEYRTAKVIELVATSSKSFEDAIQNALADARATTRGITGCHVENMSIQCDDGRIFAYKVNLKVSFGVERDEGGGRTRSGRGNQGTE